MPPSPVHPDVAAERAELDRLRRRWHRPELVSPDPLELVRAVADRADREVVALVASALAYGNVRAMLPAIASVLRILGPHPAATVDAARPGTLGRRLSGWRYRFTDGRQLAALLDAAGRLRRADGSLEAQLGPPTVPGPDVDPRDLSMRPLALALRSASARPLDHLLPDPADGSACKRLCLMLRWLVRRDAIDPGGWTRLAPRHLVMPVDVHVHRAARARGWTARRTPDLRAALEITARLARLAPADPLRWDFALTRPGIRRAVPGDRSGADGG